MPEEMLPVPPKFSHYTSWKPQDVMRQLDAMKACIAQLQDQCKACPDVKKKKVTKPENDLG